MNQEFVYFKERLIAVEHITHIRFLENWAYVGVTGGSVGTNFGEITLNREEGERLVEHLRTSRTVRNFV